MTRSADRVLVLGIGNTLLSDEGAGVHALRRLQVVAGERLAVMAEGFGFRGSTLHEQRPAEECRRPRRIDSEAVAS